MANTRTRQHNSSVPAPLEGYQRRRLPCIGAALMAGLALACLSFSPGLRAIVLVQTNPELTAAQRAFIASESQAQTAEKELEEVENDVPGWMSQLPPSVLADTVHQLTSTVSFQHTSKQPSASSPIPKHSAARSVRPPTPDRAPPHPQAASQQGGIPKMTTEMRHDDQLQSLDSELTQIMAKARALKSAAKEAKTKAAIEATPTSQHGAAESSQLGLNPDEKTELGELFGLNTVLHSITKARQQTLRLEHPNDPNYKPPPPPPSPAQQKREAAEAAKKKAERLRRLKDEDMARAEGKAALQQAARVLLRQLHGNKDKWLRKTLKSIAANAAQVEADKNGIKQLRNSLESPGRESKLSGVARDALRQAAQTKTQRAVSSTEKATEAREKGEANRLLDHMLRMAHTDFSHVHNDAPKIQAEAKDGEIMHTAGKRAARDAIRREQDRRRDVAKARRIDTQAKKQAAMAAGWGRRGGLTQEAKTHATRQSTLGLLAHDMVTDIKSLF